MTPHPPTGSVLHNHDARRFEVRFDENLALLSYSRSGDRLILDHTFVPPAMRGGGVAAMLVRATLEEARRRGWRVVPRCSYVAAFIHRHPEYADVIAGPEGD